MNFQAIAAQLEFLAWRDAQLAAISSQLEEALPALLDELAEQVKSASIVNLVRSTIALKSSAEAIIQRWGADQLVKALGRAEADLDQTLLQLPGNVNLNNDVWDRLCCTNCLRGFIS